MKFEIMSPKSAILPFVFARFKLFLPSFVFKRASARVRLRASILRVIQRWCDFFFLINFYPFIILYIFYFLNFEILSLGSADKIAHSPYKTLVYLNVWPKLNGWKKLYLRVSKKSFSVQNNNLTVFQEVETSLKIYPPTGPHNSSDDHLRNPSL